MTTATQVPPRAEIPKEQTWNAESMFADKEAWQAEYEALNKAMPQLATFQGTLGDSPENLANYMATASLLRRRLRSLYFYAAMRNSVDSQDSEAKPLMGQAMSLFGQYGKYSAFAQPELLGIGQEKLLGWVEEHTALNPFHHYLE
ncbi:MAG: oligoendopeptidase F, partial [Anaerolineae bacterium]|nr:oligoendopeptidase F [Anaerolineae bacterium]